MSSCHVAPLAVIFFSQVHLYLLKRRLGLIGQHVSLATLATCLLPLTAAAPPPGKRQTGPIVQLDYSTIIGSSLLGVDSFKGIPHAQPPVGPLHLKPPQSITKNLGFVTAVGIPRACPQFLTSIYSSNLPVDVVTELNNTRLFQTVPDAGEDCLAIDVQRLSSATSTSKLPVVFWIFGGGFEVGSVAASRHFLVLTRSEKREI